MDKHDPLRMRRRVLFLGLSREGAGELDFDRAIVAPMKEYWRGGGAVPHVTVTRTNGRLWCSCPQVVGCQHLATVRRCCAGSRGRGIKVPCIIEGV